MKGTLVNVAGIIIGSLIGLLLKKGIPRHVSDSLIKAEGLAIVVIGISSVLAEMFTLNGKSGGLNSSGGLLLLVSLVVGCLIGEILRIDDHFNNAGLVFERRFKTTGFAKGLVTASLVFSMGAMSIIGPINEGLTGDTSILYIKTMLDTTTAIVLTSTLGVGVLFSSLVVLVVQAIPALLAAELSPYITPQLLSPFCMVGYTMVMAIGINFLVDAKIKIANLLPALLVPIVHYFAAPLWSGV